MKKRILSALAFVMMGSALGHAETITKVLDVEPFSKIEVSGASSLVVEQGDVQQVTVTIEQDYLARVNTDVKNGELDIHVREKGWFGGSAKGEFHIVTPRLNAIEVSGSGAAKIDRVDASEFRIELSGSGDIRIDELTAGKVRVELAGSGDIRLGNLAALSMFVEIMGSGDIVAVGDVAKLRVEIIGSGDFDGSNLDTESARGEVIGSGDIVVRSAETSHFNSIGSGDGKVLN